MHLTNEIELKNPALSYIDNFHMNLTDEIELRNLGMS